MRQRIDCQRRVQQGKTSGTEVIEFVSDDVPLICPYFHQRFFGVDGSFFLCEGRFNGRSELVQVELETGNAWRLTQGSGRIQTGDLAPNGRTFYYVRKKHLCSVDVPTGQERLQCRLPRDAGYETGSQIHVNADATRIVLFGNRKHASGAEMGRIWTFCDGSWVRILDRPFRIGHVQFSPKDPGLILYCHETGGASPQRMWLARTDGHHPGALFTEPGHPWVTHETFSGNGAWVVFVRHPEGLGFIRPNKTDFQPAAAPLAWHPGPNRYATKVVFDDHEGTLWLYSRRGLQQLVQRQYDGGEFHMHPRFGPEDRLVVWTSTGAGHPHPALMFL